MGKRTASISGHSAKRAKVTELESRVNSVIEALVGDALPHSVPKKTRGMLAIGASSALAHSVEDRHALQDQVLGHVREILGGVLADIKSKASNEKRVAGDLTAQAEALKTDLQAATSDAETADAALQAAVEKAREAAEAFSTAEAEMDEAERGELKLANEHDKLEKEKAKNCAISERFEKLAAGAQEEEVAPAVEGSETTGNDGAAAPPKKTQKQQERERAKREKEVQKLVTKVVADFTALGAEEACIASAGDVLSKKPEARVGFDEYIVTALRSCVAGKLKEVDGRIAENEAEMAKASALAKEKSTHLEGAKAAKTATAEAQTAAEAGRDERQAVKTEKEKAIETFLLEASNHQVASEVEESNASDLEGLLTTFKELCSRSSAPEQAPEATGEAKAELEAVSAA